MFDQEGIGQFKLAWLSSVIAFELDGYGVLYIVHHAYMP